MRHRLDWKRFLPVLFALMALAQLAVTRASAAPAQKLVLVAPIHGTIDLGLVPFVQRILADAQQQGAAAVVLDIDTFGGRVDAAVSIRDTLLKSPVKTVAFINKRAISAGALIALAAEKIAVARGATIGAATPIEMGGPGGEARPVGEKTVSYVRKEFRATADARKRPGQLAEAMVDPDVAIPDVIEKGKLVTLTTADALRYGVADFEADDLPQLLQRLDLTGAELRHARENWAERVVRFLTHPIVSSLLMTLGILGIIVELRTPGFGVPGIVGIACLASFFWGHWLVELAGWEQLLLLVIGLILIALEVFVLPGFGIAGVIGIVALVAALSSSLYGAGASWRTIGLALSRVMISTAIAAVGFLLLLRFVNVLPGGRKLVLASVLAGDGRVLSGFAPGSRGIALTPLRPAGIASVDGKRVDVVSQGEFVESGQPVEIVRDDGHRVVVRAAVSEQEGKIG